MPEIFQIIAWSVLGWLVINYLLGIYYGSRLEQEEEVVNNDDWIFPVHLEYTKDMWYAWDIDNTFIRQAPTKDQLITDILNQYDISPKRIIIKSEKLLNENSTTSIQN